MAIVLDFARKEIIGDKVLLNLILESYSKFFEPHKFLKYIINQSKFSSEEFGVTVAFQREIDFGLRPSGSIMMIMAPGFADGLCEVKGVYGCPKLLDLGKVDPDRYYFIRKQDQVQNVRLIRKHGGSKMRWMRQIMLDPRSSEILDTPLALRDEYCISEAQAKTLADYCFKIHQYLDEHFTSNPQIKLDWAINEQGEAVVYGLSRI